MMNNAELISMTMDEMVETAGGDDLDKPWCFLAGSFSVVMVAGIVTGAAPAAIIGAALTGGTLATSINS